MTGFLALMSDGAISIESVATAIDSMGYDIDALGVSVSDLQTLYKSYGDETAVATALMNQFSMTQEDADPGNTIAWSKFDTADNLMGFSKQCH